MANQIRQRYDIIINGGGIIGFTLLNLIKSSPHLNRCKVLLIEKASKPTNFAQKSINFQGDKRKFSNRVSSISPTSIKVFKDLGVWTSLQHHIKDVTGIKVWSYDYSDRIVFHQYLKDRKDPDVMFSVVENDRLSLALIDSIYQSKRDNLDLEWHSSSRDFEAADEEGLINVTLLDDKGGDDSHRTVTAPLVLGCDGMNSAVRKLAGVPWYEYKLDKKALVGNVKMATPFPDGNATAFQRFSAAKETVAALLPLDKEHCSFVISAPNDYASYLQNLDPKRFIEEFNDLLSLKESPDGPVLKGLHSLLNLGYDNLKTLINSVSPPDSSADEHEEPPRLDSLVSEDLIGFPLGFATTGTVMVKKLPNRQYNQIALLGDATHRVHPLAGQGLNLGIQDALELVKSLETIAKSGVKLFDPTDLGYINLALNVYESERKLHTLSMMAGIASMPSLFKILPRSFLSFLNKSDSIKRWSVLFAN